MKVKRILSKTEKQVIIEELEKLREIYKTLGLPEDENRVKELIYLIWL